jgi:PAS domain S-box-containing protein
MEHSLDTATASGAPTVAPPQRSARADAEDVRILRATIDLAPVGIGLFDNGGRFLRVNAQLCATLGYAREDLIARTFQEITFPDDVAASLALSARLLANAIPSYRHERRIVRSDGSVMWARVSVSAVRTAGGDADLFVGIIEDVSEQRSSEEARRDAEARLRVALDASRTGTFRWHPETRALDWDENLERLFGVPSPATSSADLMARVHPDDWPHIAEAWWLCVAEGTELDEEFRVVWPDGSTHWLRHRGRLVTGADGTPVFLAGACTDVTEHRRVEDELRAQEERFRTLANTIPQLAWMTDASGSIHWYNQRWFDYTGATLEEVQGWGWRKFHHPDHVDRVVERIRRSFATGEPWEDTFPLRGRDGQYRWFLSRALPIRDRDGSIVGWFGTNTDITQRLEAEQAVRATESKLRRVAESGLIGIFYWTLDGSIPDANDEFCRMLGFSRDDLRAGALNWRTLTPVEWQSVGISKEAELAARGVVTPWEKEFYAKDGHRVPVLVGSALLEGQSDRGVAVCLDISLQKEAEAERERALTLERAARGEAERAIRLRDEVLGIVAHDLRNPVHTITMSASTILEIPLPEDQRVRQLEVIRRTAKGMHHLISDLLDVTLIESGTFAIERAPVDMGGLMGELIERFAPQAHDRSITLSGDVAADLPTVSGDHGRLVQVLSNLLDNALKFTPAGRRVALRGRVVDEQVRVSVEDSGQGIAPESLPHIFDRFWQADRASRAGAGLGLAIARGIVAAHGGDITVESTVGRGTTFHLTLPRT